jgi:hypothetical protein
MPVGTLTRDIPANLSVKALTVLTVKTKNRLTAPRQNLATARVRSSSGITGFQAIIDNPIVKCSFRKHIGESQDLNKDLRMGLYVALGISRAQRVALRRSVWVSRIHDDV